MTSIQFSGTPTLTSVTTATVIRSKRPPIERTALFLSFWEVWQGKQRRWVGESSQLVFPSCDYGQVEKIGTITRHIAPPRPEAALLPSLLAICVTSPSSQRLLITLGWSGGVKYLGCCRADSATISLRELPSDVCVAYIINGTQCRTI